MVPPGMAMVSVSKRAWDATETAKIPRYYFDYKKAKSYLEKGQTPWTPAVSVYFAMDVALRGLQAEGLENIHERHARLGQIRPATASVRSASSCSSAMSASHRTR